MPLRPYAQPAGLSLQHGKGVERKAPTRGRARHQSGAQWSQGLAGKDPDMTVGRPVAAPPITSPYGQRDALTDPAIALGSAALPASSRATGTRKGEQDT
jgi:hypothetical protein